MYTFICHTRDTHNMDGVQILKGCFTHPKHQIIYNHTKITGSENMSVVAGFSFFAFNCVFDSLDCLDVTLCNNIVEFSQHAFWSSKIKVPECTP